MATITIAGEFGSGAIELGEKVSRLLGAEFVNREIIAEAARRLKVTEQAVLKRDMKPESRMDRLSRALQSLLEKSAMGDPLGGAGGLEYILTRSYQDAERETSNVTDQRYNDVVRSIIQDMARTGNAVILHRGGQFILKDRPDVLHIYVVASYEDRIKRLMSQEKQDRKAAITSMENLERGRVAYFKKFYKADVTDPINYHLVFNTSKMSVDRATMIVIAAMPIVTGKPAD